jgi:hypothetical protein
MKLASALVLSVAITGCASAPTSAAPVAAPTATTPEAPATPAAAETEAPAEAPSQTAAEAWAEKKANAEAAAAPESSGQAGADPLAVGGAMESASTTKIELTKARELRRKTRRDLEDGQKLVEKSTTFDEALQKLGTRLGKPNWIESGKKRVWVVTEGTQCYRLSLDADGSTETDTASTTESRMLSALSQQNPCTGAVQNGMPGMK